MYLSTMPSISFILQLNLLAIVVLLTIVGSLLIRKNNVKANVFLAFMVLYAPFSLALNVVFIIFKQHQFLFLAPLNVGINLTFGPVLLCYISLVQGKDLKKVTRNTWHFVPSFVVVLSSAYYLLVPEDEKIRLMGQLLAGKENYINGINVFLLMHIGFYLYAAWKKVKQYKQTCIELGVCETEESVKWQYAFLRCIIAVNLLLLTAYVAPIVVTGEAHVYSDLVAAPVVAIGMYIFMIYKGLSYHVIFNKSSYHTFTTAASPVNHFIEEVEKLDKPHKGPKYDKEMNDKLEQLFYSEKIHTKPNLKLHDMALVLDMSPAILSAFINTHLKMTFFEMVNKYRIEEAKQLLVRPDYVTYKIEYIGEISGFNSRASFFSVFKKHVGKTPLAYRDEYLATERP